MLKDAIDVFKKEISEDPDIILRDYMPVQGTYFLICGNRYDDFKIKDTINIKFDKKTGEIQGKDNINYKKICLFDYNSKLIDMNKPIDTSKIIHSNNYLSFFVKKESIKNGKLTNEKIDNYYNILINPYIKYKDKEGKDIYSQVEKEIGGVGKEKIINIQRWIKDNIFNLPFDEKGKDYIKIFFDADSEEYIKEGKRYLIPNIYNSNKLNIKVNGKILGMPNENNGLNAKKPYLEKKTRKITIPNLLTNEEVLIQRKFFDYLMNFAAKGYVNVYIDDKIYFYKNNDEPRDFKYGLFFRIKKGKEVEISDFDVITNYSSKLSKSFVYKDYIEIDSKNPKIEFYKKYVTRKSIENLLDKVVFSNHLINNYFVEPKDIKINDSILKSSLLVSRNIIFNWSYKGANNGFYKVINNILVNLIKSSILNNLNTKAINLINLKWSLNIGGSENMGDIALEIKDILRTKINSKETLSIKNDDEYYFALGQLVYFLLSKNKSGKKPQSLINAFLNAKSDEFIKQKITNLYKKYNYDIELSSKRINNLYAMVKSYVPDDSKYNLDLFEAGFLHSNLVYESKEEN